MCVYIFIYIFFCFFKDNDECVLWLQHNTKPWIKVTHLWEKTSKIRLRSFQTGTKTIQNYINQYPVLKEPQGYTLVRR